MITARPPSTAASKGSDTIEVAYLNGVDTPYIDQMEGFSVDGVTTKVRIDAGVAPVDHRGFGEMYGVNVADNNSDGP